MANLATLADRIASMRKAIPAWASQIAVNVAIAVDNDLLQVTPVDSGTAMSNWIVTVGSPADETQPAFALSPRGKTMEDNKTRLWVHAVDPEVTRSANLPLAQAAAQAVLQEKQTGKAIYLTNNLPYIIKLDNGSSSQFPGGFIDRALIVAEHALETHQRLTY
jgi:hypothetical protein